MASKLNLIRNKDLLAVAANQRKKEKKYWLKNLSDVDDFSKCTFPYSNDIADNSDDGYLLKNFKFPNEIFLKISRMSNNSLQNCFIILVAGLGVLLYKSCGNDILCMGTPILRQDKTIKFYNTLLLLKFHLKGEITFKEFLYQVKQVLIESTNHQNFPLEWLEDNLDTYNSGFQYPFFHITILLKNIQDKDYIQHIKPDMTFSFLKTDNDLEGELEYKTSLYDRLSVEKIITHFKELMRKIVLNPGLAIKDIEIITSTEKKQILYQFNKPGIRIKNNHTVLELFELQVEKTPHAISVVFEDKQLTYSELNKRANQLSSILIKKGITSNEIIAIFLDISLDTAIAILGVLKSGAGYLPIDYLYPIDRVISILEDSQAEIVITASNIVDQFSFTEIEGLKLKERKIYITKPRENIVNIDSLPIPDRSYIDYEKYSQYIGQAAIKETYITILTTRGCPYNCAYCHRLWPKKHIYRSARNIFDEVKLFYKMGVRRFVIVDDIFNFNVKNSLKLFKLIIDQGLKIDLFFPNGLRGDLLNEEYIDLMVKAGTVNLALALETASPRLQKMIGKNLNIEKIKKNIEYICENYPHVVLELFIMHGFPGETKKETEMTFEFLKGLKWVHFPYLSFLRVYLNTGMEKFALMKGFSRDDILKGEMLTYSDLPDLFLSDKNFTLKLQARFLDDYFLSKERLLHVLPYQMKVFTREEIVQKYDSYLPTDIKTFEDLLTFAGIKNDERIGEDFLTADKINVPNLNDKVKKCFPKNDPFSDSLRILLLDLSQFFSNEKMKFYNVLDPPLGLMYLMTYLKKMFGDQIRGRIIKSHVDFDSYNQLRKILREFQPDVIGIRTLTLYKDFFHKTVSKIRQWGFNGPIITGGPYASSSSEIILQDRNIDLLVFGEGEETFAELIKAILRNNKKLPDEPDLKKIPGIAFVPKENRNPGYLARQVLMMDVIQKMFKKNPGKNPKIMCKPNDLAYIIYTSGSTGRPKGIIVEQKSFVDFTTWAADEYGHKRGHRVLLSNSFAFDGSIQQIFPTLVTGGILHLIRPEARLDLAYYFDYLKKNRINNIDEVPTLMNELFSSIVLPETSDILPDLTFLSLGSEYVPIEIVRKCRKHLNKNGRIINGYGPAEASVETCTYSFNGWSQDEISLIGKPRRHLSVYILDPNNNCCPIGIPGEICVSGIGVARGYLNIIEATAKQFIDNPYIRDYHPLLYKTGDRGVWLGDGNIKFLGRIDSQVNIRGCRVELKEIENQLYKFDGIVDSTVVEKKDSDQSTCLCAYYVLESKNKPLFWPSYGDYNIYDEFSYDFMTGDKYRNKYYKLAVNKLVKDKVVVEIGTGQDAILSRFCINSGAKKVFAIEIMKESYLRAKKSIKKLGLEEKIILIHGDSREVKLPEKVDICLSEIIGNIGGAEGAASTINNARRFLKEKGKMIPAKCLTNIAAIKLPDSLYNKPKFSEVALEFVGQIFDHFGYKFDLRVCIENFPQSHIISDYKTFEFLDFENIMELDNRHKIDLTVTENSRCDGFLLWLNLYTDNDNMINNLEHKCSWLPVYIPLFFPGIQVNKGDRIEIECIRSVSENTINPDYHLIGVLKRDKRILQEFKYSLPHQEKAFKENSFYDKLFQQMNSYTYKNLSQEFKLENLKGYLRNRLPEYMIPTYFVEVEKIPLTVNGKVDKRALPEPGKFLSHKDENYVAPKTELEKKILNVWKDVLKMEKVGIHNNFFDIGGNSLKAIQLSNKLKEVVDQDISVIMMFKYMTIHSFVEYLKNQTVMMERPDEKQHSYEKLNKLKQRKLKQKTMRRNHINA